MTVPLLPLLAAASPASSAVHPDVALRAVETVIPAPGEFATLTCRAEYRPDSASGPCDLLVRFQAPPGWHAVSSERTVSVEPGEGLAVPFTAWVPPQASSDSLHIARFALYSLPDSSLLALVESGLRVRTSYGVKLESSTEELDVRAGEKASFTVRVQNTGNKTDTFRLETESSPLWPVVLDSTEVVVPAGATAPVKVIVGVPSGTRAGTMRLFGVSAVSKNAERSGLEGRPRERLEVRVGTRAQREVMSRYARLPLEATISAGEVAPGQSRVGLCVSSSGQVGPGTAVQVEADLASGPRANAGNAWQDQLLRARVTRAAWDVSAGDVSGQFSDLATATISGRGIGFIAKQEAWTLRALGVRNRGVGHTQSWGMGLSRVLSSGPQVGGDLVYRQESVGRFGVRSDRLFSLTSGWDAPHGVRLDGDLALSGTSLAERASTGRAVQLVADRTGRLVQLRARMYTGSSGFGGRTRDRDGVLLFGSYAPNSRPLRCWSHLESTRGRSWFTGGSPTATTTRYRTGARWERPRWPSLELSLGGLDDRSVLGDSARSSTRHDAGITASWSRGRFLAAAAFGYGAARDRATGRSGPTNSAELSAGGSVQDWRLALRWNRERDWAPTTNASSTLQALAVDAAWTAPSSRFTAGIGISSRRMDAGRASASNNAEFRLQPRGEYRLGAKLRLRLDAYLTDLAGSTRVDRWQMSLGYTSDEIVPVPWIPVRGGIRGVAFLDADGDGELDVGEKRMDGLRLRLDGRHRVTDRHGVFEWPALDPATYWIDLDRASIPGGLAVSAILPLEARVEAGEDLPVLIPLLPSGEASGIIFLDDNHDGRQTGPEAGVPDMRVTAWRDGRQVADGITDRQGRFHLRGLPVGVYELRIDPAWLPEGWTATGAGAAEFSVTAGRHVNLTPYGIGPRQKPIIITYPGSHAPEKQEVTPPPEPGGSPSEPDRQPKR
jgi:hypothetical protein